MATSSTGRVIRLPGYRVDEAGKIVRDQLNVSARLQRRASKRVRVNRSDRA